MTSKKIQVLNSKMQIQEGKKKKENSSGSPWKI